MLAGMGYELETQWRQDDDAAKARDSEHYRAAMESLDARRTASRPASRPGALDRMIGALRAWAGFRATPAGCNPSAGRQVDPAH